MWLLVTSPSTTSRSPRIGRPRGQRKAERRLKRELANKSLLNNAITEAGGLLRDVFGTAATSPIVGTVSAIVILDLLHQSRLLSDGAWLTGFALVGAIDLAAAASSLGQAVGTASSGVGNIIPSSLVPFTSSSKSITISSQESLIANSPNVKMPDSTKDTPSAVVVSEKGYVPE